MFLKTFGGLTIAFAEGEPTGAAAQRRRLALLALLAAAGDRGLTREKVIGYLWPESDEERSRAALAQALYALRRDLRAENAIEGTATLKLNEEVLPSDVGRFRRAAAEGRFADAAALYQGPFLDGIHIADAEEFSRWADEERAQLAREAASAMEKAAAAAAAAADHAGAVSWWRRRAAIDPLEARAARGLMEALTAAGDRAAAIQHARIYESLVRDQLGVAPDPSIRALVSRLSESSSAAAPSAAAPSAAVSSAPESFAPSRRRAWPALVLVAAAIALVSLALVLTNQPAERPAAPAPGTQLLAVGAFRAYGPGAAEMAGPITDMLATNLASDPSLTVLSSSRLYELAAGQGSDSSGLLRAARTGGATTLLDGALYIHGDSVRLDIRRTDLLRGTVSQAVSVHARDVFSAVDLATARLLSGLGGEPPRRSIAAVTTSSLVAYRLYVEGLKEWYAGRRQSAHRLFAAAVAEDSGFAMAEHYAAQSVDSPAELARRSRRAIELAARASDRERLLIRWHWANWTDDITTMALSESLVTRFDAEPFAHLAYGRSLVQAGRFLEAVPRFQTAVDRDRGRGLDITPGACIRCEARHALAHAWYHADSTERAVTELRQWTRDEPRRAAAWGALADLLYHTGRWDEALPAARTSVPLGSNVVIEVFQRDVDQRRGNFAAADASLLNTLRNATAAERREALWMLTFSYRAQGRLRDAMETATSIREGTPTFGRRDAAPYEALQQAAVMYEGGRYRESAALFDSIARLVVPTEPPSRLARHRVWLMTLSSSARAAAGDTTSLPALADSIEQLSRQTAFGRDHRLHHHVRGLMYAARQQHSLAAESFARAIYSPVVGYTRSNIALAQSLVAAGRPAEAIAPLRSAFNGPVGGPNTYVSRTEIQEQLALAFAAAGRRDSARVYARSVATAWRNADPVFRERLSRMQSLAE